MVNVNKAICNPVTTPGLEYTPNTKEHSIFTAYQKALAGDKGDNIVGLKGIGPVRAAKILQDKYVHQTAKGWNTAATQAFITATEKSAQSLIDNKQLDPSHKPTNHEVFVLAANHLSRNLLLMSMGSRFLSSQDVQDFNEHEVQDEAYAPTFFLGPDTGSDLIGPDYEDDYRMYTYNS